jgi:hypothetical protein
MFEDTFSRVNRQFTSVTPLGGSVLTYMFAVCVVGKVVYDFYLVVKQTFSPCLSLYAALWSTV